MTVIIPAYNCSHVLHRALNSLVKQSDKDFSVVLVDDCSTEDLSIIIKQYKDKLNITHIYTSENQGCGGARQRGIEHVGTNDDYITFLDADDILIPQAIEIWKKAMITCPDVIYTPVLTKPLDTKDVVLTKVYNKCGHAYITHGKVYKTIFLHNKKVYSDPRFRYFFNDYFLNHQILNYTTNIVFLEDICYIYIKTPNSATTNPDNVKQYYLKLRALALHELRKIFKKNKINITENTYYYNEWRMNRIYNKMKNKQYNDFNYYIDTI